MIEKKLNWKLWFFVILFGGVLILAARVIYMMLTGQVVSDENGEPLPWVFEVLMVVLTVLVCSTYAATVFTLLRQVMKFGKTAFVADGHGLHNTFAMIGFFAFVITVPVEFIPWQAVSYIDISEGEPYIRVKARDVKASRMAKAILAVKGYTFCIGFTTEAFSKSETEKIKAWCYEKSEYLGNK